MDDWIRPTINARDATWFVHGKREADRLTYVDRVDLVCRETGQVMYSTPMRLAKLGDPRDARYGPGYGATKDTRNHAHHWARRNRVRIVRYL